MRFNLSLVRAWVLIVIALSLALCSPLFARAQEGVEQGSEQETNVATSTATPAAETKFSVTPVVANERAKARDILKKELVVANNTNERMDLYISVENIDPSAGAQEPVSPGVADLSVSLANWIEITRGVIELSPGESRKIPYLIHVNLSAQPGSYFARILFREGAKRTDGESATPDDGTSLLLNLQVEDDAKERLQLGNFLASDTIVFGDSIGFSYLLENVGNRKLEPRGSIRIFNRRGEEVGSVPLNADGQEITPENKKQLAAAWDAAGRFGKYKAFLDLEYGEQQLASVQDTVYFWVFPWREMLFAVGGMIALAFVGTFIIHMRSLARPVHAAVSVPDLPPPLVGARARSLPRSEQPVMRVSEGHVEKRSEKTRERTARLPEKSDIENMRAYNESITLTPRTQRAREHYGETVDLRR